MTFWHKKNKLIRIFAVSTFLLLGIGIIVKSGIYFLKTRKPELYTKIFYDTGNVASNALVKIINNKSKDVQNAGLSIDANDNSASPTLIGENNVSLTWDKKITLDKVKILVTGDSSYSIMLKTNSDGSWNQIGSLSTSSSQVEFSIRDLSITTNQLNLFISSPKPFRINEISVFNIEPQTHVILFERLIWSVIQPILIKLFTFFLPIILIIPLCLILSSSFRYRYLFIFPILLAAFQFFQNSTQAFDIIVVTNFIALPFLYKKKYSLDVFVKIVCVIFFLFLSVLSMMKMYSFSSGWTLDYATLNNALWNFTHLKNFFSSDLINIAQENQGKLSTVFGHSSFILIPISLIYRLFPRPETLVFVQSFSLALSCYIFYLIAKHRLGDKKMATIIFLCLIFYPQLTWIGLADFRPEIFSILFLFLTFYFIPINSRYAILSFIGAMFSSELNSLYGITLSVYLFATKKKTLALMFIIVGISYFLFFTKVLSPLLSAGEDVRTISDQYGYFQYVLKTYPPTTLDHFARIVDFLKEPFKMSLFLRYFDPLFRIPFYNPIFWVMGFPGIFRLLALNVHLRNFYESALVYYVSSLVPIMFFTTTLLIQRLSKKMGLVVVTIMLSTTLLRFNLENKSDYGLYRSLSAFHLTDRDRLAYQAAKLIPDDAVLYVSQKYLVPLSSREKIYTLNDFNANTINHGDYFLVDLLGKMGETDQDEEEYKQIDKLKIVKEYINTKKDLLSQNNVNLIFNKDGILLYKKVSTPPDH